MLARHMQMQRNEIQHMHKQIEVRTGRQENLDMINKWQQAIKNYQTEYDRIRNHLASNLIPDTTREHIVNRKATLRDLGAQAFDYMQQTNKIFNNQYLV
jgi:uncharacterized protein (DUF111 family)